MYLVSFYSKGYKLAVDFCMNFSQEDSEENIVLWILHFFLLTIQQFSEGGMSETFSF